MDVGLAQSDTAHHRAGLKGDWISIGYRKCGEVRTADVREQLTR